MCKIVCLLVAGPEYTIVDGTSRKWRFEDNRFSGPIVLTPKTGEIMKNQPGEKSTFWDAVQCWYDQGKKVGADGLCIWKPKPKPILKHLGGRHYEVIGYEGE